jgi:glucose-6-phosphate isomerase
MDSQLTLDVGGLTEGVDVEGLRARGADAVDTILANRPGFLDLPDDRATARACMDYARELPSEVDTMVVLGIGGSSLGARAIYSALARPFDTLRTRSPGMPRRIFFADNVDPVSMRGLLEVCDPAKTVWSVCTKSGSTAETAAQLLVIADRVPDERIVATTDPATGALRKTAEARGWKTFAIRPDIGGRFSVLTPVGLLPAAVAGLDVQGLLDGARRMRDRCLSRDLHANPALSLATLLHAHDAKHRRSIHVLMTYVDGLYDTADWFRQLWAESLGKSGKGPTPIAARGATDQHSQLQLYAEGPDDKVVLLLSVKERGLELTIPGGPLAASQPEYAYLAGRGMGELLDAALRGTMGVLARRQRPVGAITLARPSAEALGELLMMLECTSVFAAPLYGVDPYGEPAIEEAKKLTSAALGRHR